MPLDFITPEAYRERTGGPSLRGHLGIITCRSSKRFAERVVEEYNSLLKENGSRRKIELIVPDIRTFPDGEVHIKDIHACMRGLDAYIFQQTYNPTSSFSPNDNVAELELLLSTVTQRQDAMNATVVIPCIPYQRQDKQDYQERQPISGRVFADKIQLLGARQVVTATLHAPQIKGFWSIPVDEIDLFKTWLQEFHPYKGHPQAQVIALDAGALKFAQLYERKLGLPLATANKIRNSADNITLHSMTGLVQGRNIAIGTDDQASTCGTMLANGAHLHDYGFEELHIAVTHALFTGQAIERLQELYAIYQQQFTLHITDTVPQPEDVLKLPFIRPVSLAKEFAATVNRIHYGQSLSEPTIRLIEQI